MLCAVWDHKIVRCLPKHLVPSVDDEALVDNLCTLATLACPSPPLLLPLPPDENAADIESIDTAQIHENVNRIVEYVNWFGYESRRLTYNQPTDFALRLTPLCSESFVTVPIKINTQEADAGKRNANVGVFSSQFFRLLGCCV